MEPDPTKGAAQGATAVATPPAATPSHDTSTPSPAPAPAGGEPQTAPDPGRAQGEDFNHPVYGLKLRNFQKGLEEKSKALKALEEKHGTTAQQIADLNARLATRPELLNQVRALYGLPPLPTAAAEPEPDDLTRTRQEFESHKAQLAADQAIFEKQLELGKGDLAKGREVYSTLAVPTYELMKAYDDGDARTRLTMFMEYQMLKSSRQNTPAPAPLLTSGLPGTEMGRGAATQATVDDGPMTPEKALRAIGMSPADWAREHGLFD